MMLLKNASVISGGKLLNNYNLLVEGNRIVKLTRQSIECDNIIDCTGLYVAAGYIDIHTHGGYLHDVMEGTPESIEKISKFHLDMGTTTFLPTTLTSSIASLTAAIDNVRKYMTVNKYSRIHGLHLEGPFFTPRNAGAQPPQYLLEPDENNTKFIFDNEDIIKRIAVAPDVKGIAPYVGKFTRHGIQVSGGHDSSVDTEISACIEEGMNSVTHFSNCTSMASRRPLPHKHLGLTEIALLDDRLYVEVICDNRHIPFPYFKIIYKMKGADKIMLVSDSLSLSGMGNIRNYLGKRGEGYEIEVKDGVGIITLLNTYAGSVTPIARMVQILIRDYSIPIEEAVIMGSLNQARLLKLDDRGDMKEGMLADINIMDNKGEIKYTIFNGKTIKAAV